MLFIQDGTDLNFDHYLQGVGLTAKNQRTGDSLGIHMHATLAVNGDGVPLSVPQIQFESLDEPAGQAEPLKERKIGRWTRGLQECAVLAAQLDGVSAVSVMDCERDLFALLAEQRRLGMIDLLVRAPCNRGLGKGLTKQFDALRAAPAQARPRVDAARYELRWPAASLLAPDGEAEPVALHLRACMTSPADRR